MSESAVTGSAAWRSRPGAVAAASWAAPDARRWLQLGLAASWLLDAVLQYQSFMFTRAFPQLLAGTAQGNPAVIADPITWSARIIAHHTTATNAAFASTQLLLALGIACRPTVTIALAASIPWALAVWWLGEGLGGVLAGTASPVSGAPGAVIIYALLAVLLWPADRAGSSSFVAGRPLGAPAARAAWLVLWGSLAYFTLAQTSPGGIRRTLAAMASGQRGWISAMDQATAGLLAHGGAAVPAVPAVVLRLRA